MLDESGNYSDTEPQIEEKSDFNYKYNFNDENDEVKSNDSYEMRLDKEIEDIANIAFKEYIDKLEVEEKDDKELLKLDKKEILDFKNYQIKKYQVYIGSLEKEKEDLMENFKETTNVLLDRIKELEEKSYGVRPQTAVIMDKISKKDKKTNDINFNYSHYSALAQNSNQSTKTTFNLIDEPDMEFIKFPSSEDKERCVKCKQYFAKETMSRHSLECLRKPAIQCKICKESIEEQNKEEHIQYFRKISVIQKAVEEDNLKLLDSCLNHGFDYKNMLFDNENGYYLVHFICQKGSDLMLNLLLKKADQSILNSISAISKETPLVFF